jgi:hypothetical protein
MLADLLRGERDDPGEATEGHHPEHEHGQVVPARVWIAPVIAETSTIVANTRIRRIPSADESVFMRASVPAGRRSHARTSARPGGAG